MERSPAARSPKADLIAALEILKGIADVTAVTIVAELGNLLRVRRLAQLFSFVRTVPTEHSSGDSRHQGRIMDTGWRRGMSGRVDYYSATYGSFATSVQQQVRAEAYGEDIGQNSWLTADEWRRFLAWLELSPSSVLLEVGSGSGGPAVFAARTLGVRVIGIEVNDEAIRTANDMAKGQAVNSLVRFQRADANRALEFRDESFDGIICVDAMNHLANRLGVLREWHRVLKPGGRVLFTDPVVVTGLVSNEEIAVRSSIGYFIFAPIGEDERLIKEAGFKLLRREDATRNMAAVSGRRLESRAHHREELIQIEGKETYDRSNRFFTVVHTLSSERRLSRYLYVARKSLSLG